MSAAERAHAQAVQGAAEHRAETDRPLVESPAALYRWHVLDEKATFSFVSHVRALGFTVMDLAAHHHADDAALGAAVRQAIAAHNAGSAS